MPLVESSFHLIARDQIFVSLRIKGDSLSGVALHLDDYLLKVKQGNLF